MNKLNRVIDRYCALHPNFGIPNLMLYIVVCNVIVYLLSSFSSAAGEFLSALSFTLNGVLHGQIWRLVTFVLIPESSGPISLLISCYFYYWIGNALERQWGTAKFTCYYLGGMLLTIAGASVVSLISGLSIPVYGAGYVNFAMFLAFAMLWPDAQVLLFFFIPIRIRYLAYIDLAFFALRIVGYIVSGAWYYTIIPVMALVNFAVFFWPELQRFFPGGGARRARNSAASAFRSAVNRPPRASRQAAGQQQSAVRKCAVCGRTEAEHPELQFRYCSRCAGYHCFCSDHIFSHVHFTDENP